MPCFHFCYYCVAGIYFGSKKSYIWIGLCSNDLFMVKYILYIIFELHAFEDEMYFEMMEFSKLILYVPQSFRLAHVQRFCLWVVYKIILG